MFWRVEGTSLFRRLGTGRTQRRIVFLAIFFVVLLIGSTYYVTHDDSSQVGPEGLLSASAQSGYKINYASPEPTVTLSTAKRLPWPFSDDEEALVDTKTKSVEDLALDVAATIRNLPSPPYILGDQKNGPKYFHNSSCAPFPSIYNLEFSNTYWQTLRTSNGSLWLYGAYLDIRKSNPLGPTLRILGMMNRIEPNVTTYCQIWFKGVTKPLFSKVIDYNWIWYKEWGNYEQGIYEPYLLSCQVPLHGKIPASVSVVEKPCDAANNNLRVVFDKPAKKKKFGVCVKGLNYMHEDISVRLVEWIELLGILGADKIFLYDYGLHPNATKVLRHYEQTENIDVTPLTLPGRHPSDPRLLYMYMRKNVWRMLLHELIPLNDCLYRNLYQYEYIAVFDTDEVIMPTKGGGWTELMQEVDLKSRLTSNDSMSSYSFRQLHFVDDVSQGHELFKGIPKYMYMLQNVYRSPKTEEFGYGTKCFHNPEHILTMHNHFPFACFNDLCNNYDVETSVGQLQHYSQDCRLALEGCTKEYRESTLLDTNIWRYKDELIERSRAVLGALGFIPSFSAKLTT